MATINTTCRLCLVRCGMVAETHDDVIGDKNIPNAIPNVEPGTVYKVQGDRDHPLSKGYLCVKGKASVDYHGCRRKARHLSAEAGRPARLRQVASKRHLGRGAGRHRQPA